MKRSNALGFAIVLFSLAACNTIDLGSLGDILGSTGASDRSDIRGTVQQVDTSNRVIILDVNTVNQLRDSRPGSSIYYDNETTVVFQNQAYRPEDLERGDQVSVQGSNQNGRFYATRIEVLRDASPY